MDDRIKRWRRGLFWSPLRARLPIFLLMFLFAFSSLAKDPWDEFEEEWQKLNDRCLALQDEGKLVEGRDFAEGFLTKSRKELGEENDVTAQAYHWVAYFMQVNNQFGEAEKLWLKALEIDEKLHGKESLKTTRRLNMLGNYYREKGDFARARELLLRALAIREEKLGKEHLDTGSVLYSLASLSATVGEYEKAEEYFLRAIPILEKSWDKFFLHENVGNPLTNLAYMYLRMDDTYKAEQCVLRALESDKRDPEASRKLLPYRLGVLVRVYWRRGDYDEAKKYLEESLAVLREQAVADPVQANEFRDCHRVLGELYIKLGNLNRGEAILRQALIDGIKNEQLPWTDKAWIFQRLAELEEDHGNYEAAEEFVLKARKLSHGRNWIDPDITRVCLRTLATVELARGRTNEAIALADELQTAEEQKLKEVLSFTSERQRLGYLNTYLNKRYSLWATADAVAPLARSVLRTKGIVLDSLLEDRRRLSQRADSEMAELTKRLEMARERIVGLNAMFRQKQADSRSEYPVKELGKAFIEAEGLESALARKANGVGSARRALSVTLEEVQLAIPEDTALVEMVQYEHYEGCGKWENNYGALLILRSAEPRWIRLGRAESIERDVQFYLHALHNSGEDETLEETLRQLFTKTWKPIAEALSGKIKRVVISPDGELNFVSFAALPQGNGRFVGEDFEVSYVWTGRDLLEDGAEPAKNSGLAIWANPAFGIKGPKADEQAAVLAVNRAATAREWRDLNLEPLRGAEREGKLLRANATALGLTPVSLFLGDDATEAELRRINSPHILHLATHGFVLPDISEEKAGSEFLSREALPSADNPMLRSGLALAGAQQTIESWKNGQMVPPENDGVVTAEEVAMLNLTNTWLVVLSACETGSGEAQRGEGVLGLRRGFIQAGAQNLLMTLWAVDDERTADLVFDFYNNLHLLGSPAEALARTQCQWLRRLREDKGIAAACRIAGPFILNFRGGLQAHCPETASMRETQPKILSGRFTSTGELDDSIDVGEEASGFFCE
jgi:CHAT domain-containing protein